MNISGKAILLVALTSVVLTETSCAHVSADAAVPCSVGQSCRVEGKFEVFAGEPVWLFLLQTNDGCMKLALPESFNSEAKSWDGRKVVVSGQMLQQMSFDDSEAVTFWYAEKDRRIAMGICDQGRVIYVDTLSSKGRKWPSADGLRHR